MPQTKEERKAYRKAYYEKNKEEIIAKNKAYRERNIEATRATAKAYMKTYRETNKERKKAYYEKNKEKIKAYNKVYDQTPAGKKARRTRIWKSRGVICDDFDALYEQYINTLLCEECEVELTEDKVITPTTRCLDHCHETHLFRNVLCNACNVRRG